MTPDEQRKAVGKRAEGLLNYYLGATQEYSVELDEALKNIESLREDIATPDDYYDESPESPEFDLELELEKEIKRADSYRKKIHEGLDEKNLAKSFYRELRKTGIGELPSPELLLEAAQSSSIQQQVKEINEWALEGNPSPLDENFFENFDRLRGRAYEERFVRIAAEHNAHATIYDYHIYSNRPYAAEVIKAAAQKDPEAVLKYAEQNLRTPLAAEIIEIAAKAAVQKEAWVVLAYADVYAGQPYAAEVIEAAARSVANNLPVSALAYADVYADQPYAAEIIKAAAQKDPQAALKNASKYAGQPYATEVIATAKKEIENDPSKKVDFSDGSYELYDGGSNLISDNDGIYTGNNDLYLDLGDNDLHMGDEDAPNKGRKPNNSSDHTTRGDESFYEFRDGEKSGVTRSRRTGLPTRNTSPTSAEDGFPTKPIEAIKAAEFKANQQNVPTHNAAHLAQDQAHYDAVLGRLVAEFKQTHPGFPLANEQALQDYFARAISKGADVSQMNGGDLARMSPTELQKAAEQIPDKVSPKPESHSQMLPSAAMRKHSGTTSLPRERTKSICHFPAKGARRKAGSTSIWRSIMHRQK